MRLPGSLLEIRISYGDRDDSGVRMKIKPLMGRRRGMPLRVRTLLSHVTVLVVVFADGAALASPPDGEYPRTTIADAVAECVASAGRQTCLTGVVTWRFNNELVIQDETGGIWVALGKARRTKLLQMDRTELEAIAVGNRLEVRGSVEPGGFAPFIVPRGLCVMGNTSLPAAQPVVAGDFFRGLHDCLRVEMSGKVRSWTEQPSYWVLNSDSAGRRFTVEIPKNLLAAEPTQYENLLLTSRGVVTTIFNTRGEMIHPNIKVATLDDLLPIPNADAPEHQPSLIALPNIASFRPDRDEFETIRTSGIVTYVSPGKFVCLQEGIFGIVVECPTTPAVQRGDRVEAIGRIDRRSAVAGISDGLLHRIRHGTPPPPLVIRPATIVANNTEAAIRSQRAEPSDYFGVLIRFGATVFDAQPSEAGGTLLLDTDGCTVTAALNRGTFGRLATLAPGSSLTVTGIVLPPDVPASRLNRPSLQDGERHLRILIRDADDISVVAAPSWWTASRLVGLLAAVACLALAAFAWGILLRMMVARQKLQLETTVRSQTLLNERLRIARDLHDTMEQDLACLMMRLDAEASLMSDERSVQSMHQMRRCLSQVQADTHDFLWDLRDPIRVDGNLPASLASQVAYMQSMTDVLITFDTRGGVATSVPGSIQHALLRITREALGNAIRHAAASHIDVELTQTARSIVLSITDDGNGFDALHVVDSEGHYGIAGIRDRAERIDAICRIDSGHGKGTTIVIDAPILPS